MATAAQRDALLSVTCPWCGASPKQPCQVRVGRRVLSPSTLDGEAHDARWRAALHRPAAVVGAAVWERTGREPVPAGRPW